MIPLCVTCLRPVKNWYSRDTSEMCCDDPRSSFVEWRPDYPPLNRFLAQMDLAISSVR